MNTPWSLHEAKNRFSEVVEAAQRGEPQTVTKGGVPAVVVLSAEQFQHFQSLQASKQPSFTQHLLDMPTMDEAEPDPFERMDLSPRDADL